MVKIEIAASAVLCAAFLAGCEGMETPRMPEMSAIRSELTDFTGRTAAYLGPGAGAAKAERATPTGDDFSKALYLEYSALAEAEYRRGDYRDSDRFADRAIKAAANEDVGPEALSSRALPASKEGELGQARERLTRALASGGRSNAPANSARAQAMFDCWMEEQEENFQPDDIAMCRSGFMTAMASVDAANIAALDGKKYVVYFPLNGATLTPASTRLVEQAIDDSKKLGGARIILTGHTDKAGPEAYNRDLSSKRALAVVDLLKESGLPETSLEWKAAGETAPAVETRDGVANKKNRRVELVISK